MTLDGAAAARTAIADGIEASKQGILEERHDAHVRGRLLPVRMRKRFIPGDAPTPLRVVIYHHTHKRLTDDNAHIQRLAGIFTRSPTWTFQYADVIRLQHHQIAGCLVGDDMLQVLEVNIFFHQHQLPGGCQRNDFAVVGICKGEGVFGREYFLPEASNRLKKLDHGKYKP